MAFSNGRAVLGVDVVKITPSKYIQTNGDQYIAREALPYLVAAAIAFYGRTGIPLWIEEAYRSYETQVAYFTARYTRVAGSRGDAYWNGSWWVKKAGQATAAVPGTSFHGLGLAIDAWSGVNVSFTAARHTIWLDVATALGWLNTGTGFGEPWHQEWALARVKTIISSAGTGAETVLEDDMPLTSQEKKEIASLVADEVVSRIFKSKAWTTVASQAANAAKRTAQLLDPAKGAGYLVWSYKLATQKTRRTASDVIRSINDNTK